MSPRTGAALDLATPRTAFVISPQPWRGFKVSKHQYASALAARGHKVFFINPPRATGRPGAVTVTPSEVEGLSTVDYRPWFPYALKFQHRPTFNLLMRHQARRIVRAAGPPDLVWDFDNAFQFADLTVFGAPTTIFHPVDDFAAGRGHKKADLVLSVSDLFLARSGADPARSHVIPHGLGPDHAAHAKSLFAQASPASQPRRVRAGYVGNLGHVGIDWPTLTGLMTRRPDVDFVFYGPHDAPSVPLAELKALKNCILRGTQPAAAIIAESGEIDLWLLCYDRKLTVDGGINSHKILEYFATGKTVLSSRIETYADSPLVAMTAGEDNAAYADLFDAVLADLDVWNGEDQRRARIAFALRHDYSHHLDRIADLLRAL